MRPVRKPRHWWKGMANDVPGRGRKAFASLFSTLRVKTFRGPSSGRLCLPSSLHLSKYFSHLSPSILFLLYITYTLSCNIFQLFADRRRPVGLRTTVVKFNCIIIYSSDCKQIAYLYFARVENIDARRRGQRHVVGKS